MQCKFKVGDRVESITGYKVYCIVTSVQFSLFADRYKIYGRWVSDINNIHSPYVNEGYCWEDFCSMIKTKSHIANWI